MAMLDDDEFGMEIRDSPPAHMLIKIQSFSKLSRHGVEKHESKSFVTGNYKWRLIIYPNGHGSEGDHISVYLSLADTHSLPADWGINANLSIFLHNQISNNYLCFRGKLAQRFDAKNMKWGFSISKRTLTQASNGYLVDDECAFGAEVFLSQPTQAPINECVSFHDWKICDYSKLKGVWNSPHFLAGGFQWKLKLFPNGNANKGEGGKSVSIYLECVESKSFAPHEKVKADFCIRIRNNLPHRSHSKSSSHWFTAKEDDWGFSALMPITDMVDPEKGFIVNDCCYLETQITVLDVVYTPKPKLLPP